MKEVNKNWHSVDTISYSIWMHDNTDRYIDVVKQHAARLFKVVFSEDDYRKVFNCGKMEAADYTKSITDLLLSNEIPEDIFCILLHEIKQSSLLNYSDFITERLLGKKRCGFIMSLIERVRVNYMDDTQYILNVLYGNQDEDLLKFIQENKSFISRMRLDLFY